MNTIDRYRGSLLGLAAGDALGTTLEFRPPGSFQPVSDMVGGGPFRLKPGQWTDDTSMALCLAESLIDRRGFDPVDQLKRYCDWFRNGHLSSTGDCFDIGNTTRAALIRFESTGEDFCGSTSPSRAGNGSIMRLAPVPLFFAGDPQIAIEKSGESSCTTHGAVECIDACRYLGALIAGAVNGGVQERSALFKLQSCAGLLESAPTGTGSSCDGGGIVPVSRTAGNQRYRLCRAVIRGRRMGILQD